MDSLAETLGSLPKIYRHFAVLTLAVTALMALFADGENRAAIAEEIQTRQQRAEMREANAKKFGKKELLVNKARGPSINNKGFDYSDAGDGFGAPMDRAGAAVQDFNYSEDIAKPRYAPAAYAGLQISEAEWKQLSPEERKKLLKKLRGEEELSPEERERRRQAMIAASLRRSGSANSDDE